MQSRSERWLAAAILTSLAIISCSDNSLEPAKEAAPPAALAAASVVAAMYAPDFVATAATGYDLNDAGDVVGRSRHRSRLRPLLLAAGRNRRVAGWKPDRAASSPGAIPAATSFPSSSTITGADRRLYGLPRQHQRARRSGARAAPATRFRISASSPACRAPRSQVSTTRAGWSGGPTIGRCDPDTAAAPFMWSQATGMREPHGPGLP